MANCSILADYFLGLEMRAVGLVLKRTFERTTPTACGMRGAVMMGIIWYRLSIKATKLVYLKYSRVYSLPDIVHVRHFPLLF